MRTIEDTFKIAEFLKPKVYNRFRLGTERASKLNIVSSLVSTMTELIDTDIIQNGNGC